MLSCGHAREGSPRASSFEQHQQRKGKRGKTRGPGGKSWPKGRLSEREVKSQSSRAFRSKPRARIDCDRPPGVRRGGERASERARERESERARERESPRSRRGACVFGGGRGRRPRTRPNSRTRIGIEEGAARDPGISALVGQPRTGGPRAPPHRTPGVARESSEPRAVSGGPQPPRPRRAPSRARRSALGRPSSSPEAERRHQAPLVQSPTSRSLFLSLSWVLSLARRGSSGAGAGGGDSVGSTAVDGSTRALPCG